MDFAPQLEMRPVLADTGDKMAEPDQARSVVEPPVPDLFNLNLWHIEGHGQDLNGVEFGEAPREWFGYGCDKAGLRHQRGHIYIVIDHQRDISVYF
jgi:hypothetical protein